MLQNLFSTSLQQLDYNSVARILVRISKQEINQAKVTNIFYSRSLQLIITVILNLYLYNNSRLSIFGLQISRISSLVKSELYILSKYSFNSL